MFTKSEINHKKQILCMISHDDPRTNSSTVNHILKTLLVPLRIERFHCNIMLFSSCKCSLYNKKANSFVSAVKLLHWRHVHGTPKRTHIRKKKPRYTVSLWYEESVIDIHDEKL